MVTATSMSNFVVAWPSNGLGNLWLFFHVFLQLCTSTMHLSEPFDVDYELLRRLLDVASTIVFSTHFYLYLLLLDVIPTLVRRTR